MAIDLSFLKALDRLELILKRKVHADLQGAHQASAYGEGVVFQDYKAYVPGDDFRHIDWAVFARTDKFFIRRFEEDRNMILHILVDSSASMDYGKPTSKYEYAAMIGLGFAHMAVTRNEKFTFATFSEKVSPLRPKKGMNQLVSIFDVMSRLKVEGKSLFKDALDNYKKTVSGKSLIILISDFLYDLDEVRTILASYHKSDVFVIQVLDSRERDLALSGDVILEDSENNTKMRTFISRRMQSDYQQKLTEHIYKLKDLCGETGARFISVTSDTPIFETFYHVLR
jgi:uncharacterized protein (DUF58 family)